MKYRKRSVIVDAARICSVDGTEASFDVGDGEAEWLQEALTKEIGAEGAVWALHDGIRIGTLEGTMTAHEDDYVVRGTRGEIYCVRGDIFRDLYEEL